MITKIKIDSAEAEAEAENAIDQAKEDLTKKLKFEFRFKGKIKQGFSKERSIFRNKVLLENIFVNIPGLRELWMSIISKQYNRVVPAFSASPGLPPLERDILNARLGTFIQNSTLQNSGFITKTSTKDMFIARSEALKFLKENDMAITKSSLDRVGSRILRRLQGPRIENITVTETQSAAEGAKEETSKVEKKNRKEWITVSDSKVRPAHVAAHGQVKQIEQPFIVGGEKLRRPGDTSLGASIKNVAFCRCSAIYG